MKVVFAVPSITGTIETHCAVSIFATQRLLSDRGIEYDFITITGCPCLPTARNTLVAMFLKDQKATDLFFIDSDVGFDASGVTRILERGEEIVAGIYPLKQERMEFPVKLKTIGGRPIGRDGLIEADFLPTGFMRIKRNAFVRMMSQYPELKYTETVAKIMGSGIDEAYDFFNMGANDPGQRYTTEDYAFCQRWRDIGGQLWVYPDIQFDHVGRFSYPGNYHNFLLGQSGGGEQKPYDFRRALHIKGCLTLAEMQWLSFQASKHSVIVELGSAWGRSTRTMADNMGPGAVLFAVDDWYGPREDSQMSDKDRENLYSNFYNNLSDHIKSGKVVPVKCEHSEISMADLPFPDMVFVDGSHDAKSVKRDISYFAEKLSPGGLLCVRDSNWDSVAMDVKEVIPGAENRHGTSLWSWSKPKREAVA